MTKLPERNRTKVIALCGGVGGAKLAYGLARILDGEELMILVNTGDDFEHFGLHVSPDIDTVTYTLAGCANPHTGWGRADESWRFMSAVAGLGGETWFSLGDTDLAASAVRTARLKAGDTLTVVTRDAARALGVSAAIRPVTNEALRTVVVTDEGVLPFQAYFVGRRCEPKVLGLRYEGAQRCRITAECMAAFRSSDLAAVVVCPSNPFLSVDPMLAVPGFPDLLREAAVPVVAVSPIVNGRAIKGPLQKIMGEFGMPATPQAIADCYSDFLDAFLIDHSDDTAISGPFVHRSSIVMHTDDDRVRLAREVLAVATTAAKRTRA